MSNSPPLNAPLSGTSSSFPNNSVIVDEGPPLSNDETSLEKKLLLAGVAGVCGFMLLRSLYSVWFPHAERSKLSRLQSISFLHAPPIAGSNIVDERSEVVKEETPDQPTLTFVNPTSAADVELLKYVSSSLLSKPQLDTVNAEQVCLIPEEDDERQVLSSPEGTGGDQGTSMDHAFSSPGPSSATSRMPSLLSGGSALSAEEERYVISKTMTQVKASLRSATIQAFETLSPPRPVLLQELTYLVDGKASEMSLQELGSKIKNEGNAALRNSLHNRRVVLIHVLSFTSNGCEVVFFDHVSFGQFYFPNAEHDDTTHQQRAWMRLCEDRHWEHLHYMSFFCPDFSEMISLVRSAGLCCGSTSALMDERVTEGNGEDARRHKQYYCSMYQQFLVNLLRHQSSLRRDLTSSTDISGGSFTLNPFAFPSLFGCTAPAYLQFVVYLMYGRRLAIEEDLFHIRPARHGQGKRSVGDWAGSASSSHASTSFFGKLSWLKRFQSNRQRERTATQSQPVEAQSRLAGRCVIEVKVLPSSPSMEHKVRQVARELNVELLIFETFICLSAPPTTTVPPSKNHSSEPGLSTPFREFVYCFHFVGHVCDGIELLYDAVRLVMLSGVMVQEAQLALQVDAHCILLQNVVEGSSLEKRNTFSESCSFTLSSQQELDRVIGVIPRSEVDATNPQLVSFQQHFQIRSGSQQPSTRSTQSEPKAAQQQHDVLSAEQRVLSIPVETRGKMAQISVQAHAVEGGSAVNPHMILSLPGGTSLNAAQQLMESSGLREGSEQLWFVVYKMSCDLGSECM